MADLALIYKDGVIDLDLGLNGAVVDDGLMTAVIISLFSARRADPDDEIPDGTDDRRGWWGDIYPDVDGDLIGSRLWLLSREKQLINVVRRAETYAKEALQWLIDDGVADQVDVVGEIIEQGVMGLAIDIHKPDGTTASIRFANIWEAIRAF